MYAFVIDQSKKSDFHNRQSSRDPFRNVAGLISRAQKSYAEFPELPNQMYLELLTALNLFHQVYQAWRAIILYRCRFVIIIC